MPNEPAEMDKEQPLELIPDFSYEDRHEFVQKLAYKLWEERGGRPVRLMSTGSRRNGLCTRCW
jgi:hypothetical protein